MENYVRLNTAASPPNSRANSRSNSQQRQQYEADSYSSSDPPSPLLPSVNATHNRPGSWIAAISRRIWHRIRPPTPAPYQSQYLTLIPLSDARLRPRHTKLIVSTLLLLAVMAVVGVFLLVPRGVSVGSIDVHSTKMTFNATTLTYRIILQADVPIFNPNYLKVSVVGNVSVSFFDAEAGWSAIGPVTLAARQEPSMLAVKLDASNLPRKYTQVVYTHCFNFPRKLIFFLLGNFQASYLGYTTHLPSIDTYFMLDCSGAEQLPPPVQLNSITAGAELKHSAARSSQAGHSTHEQQLMRLARLSSTDVSGALVDADAHNSIAYEEGTGDSQVLVDWRLEVNGTVQVHPNVASSSGASSLMSRRGSLPRGCWQRLQHPHAPAKQR